MIFAVARIPLFRLAFDDLFKANIFEAWFAVEVACAFARSPPCRLAFGSVLACLTLGENVSDFSFQIEHVGDHQNLQAATSIWPRK